MCTLQTFSNIFSLLQSVKARDEGKVDSKQTSQQETKNTRNPPVPTHVYNRYDQERYKGQEGESGSIDDIVFGFIDSSCP